MKKIFLIIIAFILASVNVSAQAQRPWWFTLEQGKNLFRSGFYGNAMMAFEDARRGREDRFTRLEQDFIFFLSTPEVRRLGDSLELIEWYIADRRNGDAAAILSEVFYYTPRQSFADSVLKVLDEFERLKAYPEAEYWLGETYRVEGEPGLALRQYRRALNAKDLLETPGFDVEILYKIASMHGLRQEYQEMEKILLEILRSRSPIPSGRESIYWVSEGGSINAAMFRILENDGIDHFIRLYRNDDIRLERAHRRLGNFYYATSRHGVATEHLLFSFMIQNSLLVKEIRRQHYDFEFSTLANLMSALERRDDLKTWMTEVQYYRTAYYLGAALSAFGKPVPARQIWNFLAAHPEAGEWQEKSRSQLRSPFIERAVELP